MNNQALLKDLYEKSKYSLFTKYETQYKSKVSDAEFYSGCIELAPYSFLAFVSACLKERFDIQKFHRLIAELFEYVAKPDSDVLRFIISAPPRAGKSMLCQYYIAWLSGLNPMTAHIFTSYGQRLSTKFMNNVALIMQREEYAACFPHFPGFKTGSNTEFKTGGSIFSTSVGGALTGISGGTLDILAKLSPGLAIIDDPLKNGESPAEIEALEPYYVDEFATRRTGNWRQGLIATRFAINDMHAIVLALDGLWDSETNPTGWLYCNLPALCKDVYSDPLGRAYNESIWPNHPTLNQAELLKLESKKKWRFTTVYQGLPYVKEDSAIKEINYPEVIWGLVNNLSLVIDSASGSTKDNDNTSITVIGNQNNFPVVLEQVSGNWTVITIREKVRSLLSKYKIERICIENASTGLALIPDYIANTNECNPDKLPVIKLSPQAYGGKSLRLEAVEDLVPVTKFGQDFKEYSDFRAEALAFPNGKKDDRVDSFVWGLIVIRPFLTLIDTESKDFYDGQNPFEEDQSQWESFVVC